MLPLYRERYILLTPTGGQFDGLRTVRWREAAALPLCLLTRDMQNRRIVERLFAEGGAESPKVAIETNSVLALVEHVRSGRWSSIVPHTFLGLLGRQTALLAGFNTVPLVEPEASQTVGLVLNDREPLPPLARALFKSAQALDLSAALDGVIAATRSSASPMMPRPVPI
jgi:DNA-binding transcriptional LysR family regulator